MKIGDTESGQELLDQLYQARFCLPFSGYPLHRHEKISPFFILGSGRSGNTLLRRILNAHSEMFIPPETYVLGAVIRQFRRYHRMYWNDLVGLIYASFQNHPEFETFGLKSLGPLAKNISEKEGQQRSLACIIDGFYREYADAHGIKAERWGDKTPANVFHAWKLAKVFPRARFIHIIRDPYDVVYSYVNAGIYSDVDAAAKRWRDSVAISRDFARKKPQINLELRYEALVTDPGDEVEKICNFLDISFESGMLMADATAGELGDVGKRAHHANVFKPITTDNIGKGRATISLKEQGRVCTIIREQAKELGYPL